MAKINEISLDVRGTLTQVDPINPSLLQKLVYQACTPQFANYYTKNGKPRMVRAYIKVINPKTPAQLAQQSALRAAVAAWHAANTETREQARQTANKRAITLYMAFISDFIKTFTPATGTIWDSGATTWDSSTTTWDV